MSIDVQIVYCCGYARREISKKVLALKVFFYSVAAESCVRVSVDLPYRNTNMGYVGGVVTVLELLLTVKGLLQQLLACWKAGVSVSEAINYRLGLVILPRLVCSVVVRAACTTTTTSMLAAMIVHVDSVCELLKG